MDLCSSLLIFMSNLKKNASIVQVRKIKLELLHLSIHKLDSGSVPGSPVLNLFLILSYLLREKEFYK